MTKNKGVRNRAGLKSRIGRSASQLTNFKEKVPMQSHEVSANSMKNGFDISISYEFRFIYD